MKFRRDKEIQYKENNDHISSCKKLETLKKQIHVDKPSFKQWVRKKQFENKIKKNLIMKALKNKYESELLKEQDREEKYTENAKRIREWETQKIYEYNKKIVDKRAIKIEKEQIENMKRKEAEDKYREWLKNNMIKLKEEKKKLKQKRLKELEEKKKKEEKEEEIKQKSKENFKKWLKNKKKQNNPQSARIQHPIKSKKPIMLAYSPNRKHGKDNSFYANTSSFDDTPESSISDRHYVRQISSKPNIYHNPEEFSSITDRKNNKRNVEDYSIENFANDGLDDSEDQHIVENKEGIITDEDEKDNYYNDIESEEKEGDIEGMEEFDSDDYEEYDSSYKKEGNLSF